MHTLNYMFSHLSNVLTTKILRIAQMQDPHNGGVLTTSFGFTLRVTFLHLFPWSPDVVNIEVFPLNTFRVPMEDPYMCKKKVKHEDEVPPGTTSWSLALSPSHWAVASVYIYFPMKQRSRCHLLRLTTLIFVQDNKCRGIVKNHQFLFLMKEMSCP